MKLGPVKPKFPWRLWHWTAANESLFALSKDELFTFTMLIDEANK